MEFKKLFQECRKVPNLRVIIVCTLILLREETVSSYSELIFRVYNSYSDVTNYDMYRYLCEKVRMVYKIDLTKLSLSDLNDKLEELATIHCIGELEIAISSGYLTELQKWEYNGVWTEKQKKMMDNLQEICGSDFVDFVLPCMTNRTITYLAITASVNADLAKSLSEYTFSDSVLGEICYGIVCNGIDLSDLALKGYSCHDLELINKAAFLPDFSLENFYETSGYVDMEKIRDFLINY